MKTAEKVWLWLLTIVVAAIAVAQLIPAKKGEYYHPVREPASHQKPQTANGEDGDYYQRVRDD